MMKNGIAPPKRGILHLRQKLAVIHEVSRANLRSSLKPLLIIAGKEKILVETGVRELPEKYRKFHTIKRKPDQTLRAQL